MLFIRYDVDKKPRVTKGKHSLDIIVKDKIVNEELLLHTDILVLSPAILPADSNTHIAQQLKVPLNDNGFFLEAHVKLRPVDFATEGVFLAGLAHSPKTISESIAQAYAAASRAMTILSSDKYTTEAVVASVNEDLCCGCGICETTCSYGAIERQKKIIDGKEILVSHVNEGLCKGCGSCASSCPSGAIEQKGFKKEQISSMIDAAMQW